MLVKVLLLGKACKMQKARTVAKRRRVRTHHLPTTVTPNYRHCVHCLLSCESKAGKRKRKSIVSLQAPASGCHTDGLHRHISERR